MNLVLVWILLSKGVCWALRLAKLEVPTSVIQGDPAWLNCSFDLEKDELYSVKWYKNNVEFYRFLPSDKPPGQKYDLKGVLVDLSKSDHGHVYLARTNLYTEGIYRCEISAEAPSFQTVRDEGELKIYVLPKEGPSITGIRAQYHVGDRVNVTCSAGPSKPAAVIKWYINGREAPSEMEYRYPRHSTSDRLQVAALGLSFIAQPSHFREGVMKLRCTAVISQAYSMSSEEIVVGDNVKSSGYHAGIMGDGPIITGGKAKYQVGDLVDVNCTSSKSRPPAELLWFINDGPVRQDVVVRYPNLKFPDGQEATVLGLRFPVKGRHFQDDEMRLKCTATLSKVINMSSEETIIGSSQQSSGLHISEHSQAVLNRGPVDQVRRTLLATFVLAIVLL